jgi:hypothetical protein
MGVVDGATGNEKLCLLDRRWCLLSVILRRTLVETGNDVVRASSNRRHHHYSSSLSRATFPTRPWTPNGTYHNTFAESDTPAGAQTRGPADCGRS